MRMADPASRSGTRYADERILDYVERIHGAHVESLKQAFASPAREGLPSIMIGPSEGRLLAVLLSMVRAQRVVEVGTLAGYSAIHIAQALPATGKLWSIEVDPRHAQVARRNLQQAGLAERAEVLVGNAMLVLPALEEEGPFDAVFIDADKEHYDCYGDWSLRNLRAGGLILADNAYFFGNLLANSPAACAMRRFHEALSQRCDSVCIPTPDGLLLAVLRADSSGAGGASAAGSKSIADGVRRE